MTGPVDKVLDSSAVVDVTGRVTYLGGVYQAALDSSAWRLERTEGTLQYFTRTAPLVPPVAVVGSSAGSVVSSTRLANGGEVDVVRLERPSTLVRSESMLKGWGATVAPASGGTSREVAVLPHDLVQSVRLPAGDWKVTFHYDAPGLMTGLVLSAVAVAAIGLGAIGLLVLGRRSRAGRVRS